MPDSTTPASHPRVALVGFGEAGEAFASAPGWRGETRAWDILPERRAAMAGANVATADNAADALGDRAFLLSLSPPTPRSRRRASMRRCCPKARCGAT
jgi:3-hydroxyisobutyrate dehydrogenase-like beta-hydroxyacid dehydrogenase